MSSEHPGIDFPWNHSQRRALLGFLILALVASAVILALHRAHLADPLPEVAPRAADLADRLDPNTATWQELAAIPGLGEKKAKAIVAWREAWQKNHPDLPAFAGPQDLRNIKGIGPATVSNMTPLLKFPANQPK